MPGVPPDAFSQVKRAFKGMFRRKQKSNQTQVQHVPQQSQQPPTSNSDAAFAAPPSRMQQPQQLQPDDTVRQSRIPDKPPQLDNPISTGSPFGAGSSLTDTSAPVTSSKPDLGPASNVDDASQPTRVESAARQEQKAASTNGTPIAAGGVGTATSTKTDTSAPVSAMEDASSMRAPTANRDMRPSEDNRPVSGLGEERESNLPTDNTDSQPNTATPANHALSPTGADPAAPAPTTVSATEQPKINGGTDPTAAPVNGDSTASKDSRKVPLTEAEKPQTKDVQSPVTHTPRNNSEDEKMPVMHEIPEIKKPSTAPGMSATSGPLEDFFPGSADVDHDEVR